MPPNNPPNSGQVDLLLWDENGKRLYDALRPLALTAGAWNTYPPGAQNGRVRFESPGALRDALTWALDAIAVEEKEAKRLKCPECGGAGHPENINDVCDECSALSDRRPDVPAESSPVIDLMEALKTSLQKRDPRP